MGRGSGTEPRAILVELMQDVAIGSNKAITFKQQIIDF